jgi:glycosyltransferase involved in cell wall biosynthesis
MSGEHGPGLDSRWAVRFGFHDVFAQAQPVASRFAQTFHWNKPIHVLPAFPDPLEVISDLPMAEHKIVPYGKARAAVFSRLVTHKKVLWLVRNWDRISNCISELHIFGTGPEEEPIRQAIARQQINDRVKCHGPYPSGQEYTDLLSQFDLTMLPTLGAEGAPLVLLESMACGVPFVAFNVGGIADYQNPDCSLVASDKPEFFFEAVQGFARKLSYGEVDQSRLQRWYLERFSYSVLASRWTEQLIPSRS